MEGCMHAGWVCVYSMGVCIQHGMDAHSDEKQ